MGCKANPRSSVMPTKFDPEGDGYDYDSATAGGIKPDNTGHWASRNPKTGQMLKGKKHKTFHLTEIGELKAGYKISKGEDGKYYSNKMNRKPLSGQARKRSGLKALLKSRGAK